MTYMVFCQLEISTDQFPLHAVLCLTFNKLLAKTQRGLSLRSFKLLRVWSDQSWSYPINLCHANNLCAI